MRMIQAVAILILVAMRCAAQTPAKNWWTRESADPALTGNQRVEVLLHNNFLSPGAVFRSFGPAMAGHFRDSPPEWDRNAAGFGRRLGTQFMTQTSRGVIGSASVAIFGRDPRYQRCGCQGGLRRAGHAFSGLWLGADAQGQRRFDPSSLLSAYGGGYAGASLYPDRYRVAVKGYQLGTQQAGQLMMQNIFLEFGPELRRFRKKIFRR